MNYDDLIGKQGKKLGPQVWACDCGVRNHGEKCGLFHVVKPTKEGLCPTCRHYAVHLTVEALIESGGKL